MNGNTVFRIDFLHFPDAATVFLCCQRFGMHPSLDDLHCDGRADDLATETQDVAVVMLTCKSSAERIYPSAER